MCSLLLVCYNNCVGGIISLGSTSIMVRIRGL